MKQFAIHFAIFFAMFLVFSLIGFTFDLPTYLFAYGFILVRDIYDEAVK